MRFVLILAAFFVALASCAELPLPPPRTSFACLEPSSRPDAPPDEQDEFPFLSTQDREMTAVHEAGHALVAYRLFGPGAVLSATIAKPRVRGRVNLHECMMPMHIRTVDDTVRRIAVSLAGIVAEQEMFHVEPAIGAQDLDDAVNDAIELATQFGKGGIGLRTFKFGHPDATPAMRERLNAAIGEFVRRGEGMARAVIRRECKGVQRLATALLRRRGIGGKEVEAILDAK